MSILHTRGLVVYILNKLYEKLYKEIKLYNIIYKENVKK